MRRECLLGDCPSWLAFLQQLPLLEREKSLNGLEEGLRASLPFITIFVSLGAEARDCKMPMVSARRKLVGPFYTHNAFFTLPKTLQTIGYGI